MTGLRIDAEHPPLLRRGEQGLGQFEGQFVGRDRVVEVGPLRRRLAVLTGDHPLQVRPVLPDPDIDRPAQGVVEQRDGVDLAGVDALEVDADQFLQSAGPGDRVRHAVLAAEVEVVQPVGPPFVTVGDLVEFVFHRSGEVVVHQPPEVLLEQPGHSERHPGGHQCAALLVHIAAVLNGLDDRGICGRPADAQLFERLDQ